MNSEFRSSELSNNMCVVCFALILQGVVHTSGPNSVAVIPGARSDLHQLHIGGLSSPAARYMIYGDSTVLYSQKNIFFELVGTWNRDLGDSDHLWTYFFSAELSGGVPGSGDGMKKNEFVCNVETRVMENTKK